MNRKEVRVTVKMMPSGEMRLIRDPNGRSTVYEDQLSNIRSAVAKCKTRDEGDIAVYDRTKGNDPHHGIHARVMLARQKLTK